MASDNAAVITIAKAGYVTNTPGTTIDRTDGTSPQASITVSNVQYSTKITVTREGDGAPLYRSRLGNHDRSDKFYGKRRERSVLRGGNHGQQRQRNYHH